MSGVTGSIPPGGVLPRHLSGQQSGDAPIYGCRAWVNFNGTGTVAIRASGNVSSITDNGTGDYTISFTTELPDADYGVDLSASGTGTSDGAAWIHGSAAPTLKTTSALRITTGIGSTGAFADAALVSVGVIR